MIWNKEKKHFNWLFISLIVFSTVSLLAFDLAWRFVTIGFIQLALISAILWAVGVLIIYFTNRKQ